MHRPIVYLAGPIAGLSGRGATDWRSDAAWTLSAHEVDTLDPMRGKDALTGADHISLDYKDYAHNGPTFTSKGIMTRDFTDVKRCDALLVNLLDAKRVSLGTVMELAWAFAMQKPTVVVIEDEGNVHDNHPMVHEAIGFRVNNLDAGIDAVASVLGR